MTDLLLESGDSLLLESGDDLLLEAPPVEPIPDTGPPVAVYRLPDLNEVWVSPDTQRGISGQREKNDAGYGQFTINVDDPAYLQIEPHTDVMVFRRNGTSVHSCVIDEVAEHTLDPNGPGGQTVTYKGRGSAIALDWAPIFPALGASALPIEDEMVADWRSPRYDPANDPWQSSTQYMLVVTAEGGGWPHQPMAEKYALDTGSYMIGPSSGDDTIAPPGWCLFYKDFNVTVPGRHGIELLMDDLGLFWVDGIQQLDVQPQDGFVTASFKRLDLSVGVHRFCWAVFNLEDPDNPGDGLGPMALAFNFYKADLQDRPLAGGLFEVSDDTVNILEFPDDWPTMTVGDILTDLWLEAVDLDFQVGHLIPTFDRVLDSNGDAWPQIGEGRDSGITTKTGTTTIFGLLVEMVAGEHVARWRVRPDAVTWDVYGPGYTTRPGDVTLEPAPVNDPRTGQLLLLDRRRT